MGMGGTAISALTTVNLVTAHGTATPFIITAIALAVFAVASALILRDAPGRAAPAESLARRLAATGRLRITWQAAALYAVAFGGYVAFSVYLPSYLKTGYGLAQADAANRMAGFVLLAVLMRPVGGWLSDRFAPTWVLAGALSIVAVGALVQSSAPSLVPTGTIAFLSMAAALGAASGATFALVALLAPADKVGSVTGVVGAAGGLGGFVPPLVMGFVYGQYGSYAAGLAALAVVAAATLVLDVTAVRQAAGTTARARARRVRRARAVGPAGRPEGKRAGVTGPGNGCRDREYRVLEPGPGRSAMAFPAFDQLRSGHSANGVIMAACVPRWGAARGAVERWRRC